MNDNSELTAQLKKSIDSKPVIIQTVFVAVAMLVLHRSYPLLNELVYLFGGPVLGLEGFELDLYIAAAATAIMLPVLAVSEYLAMRLTSPDRKGNRLFPLFALMSLTFYGKTAKVLELILADFGVNAKSWEAGWRFHNGIIYIALLITIVISAFVLSQLSILNKEGFNGSIGLKLVILFFVLTVVLNAVYIVKSFGTISAIPKLLPFSDNTVCFFGIIADVIKILLISLILLNEKVFGNSRLIKAICITVLVFGFFFNAYDAKYVPFDFIKRMDGTFFFG